MAQTEGLQIALWFIGLALLAAGPVLVLALLRSRAGRLPGISTYVVLSVAACSVAFWPVFLAWDSVLELRFRQVVPDGYWTAADEARWSEAERRVVESYFADGARNVAALFIPLPPLLYSTLVWLAARVIHGVRRRAV